MNSDLQKESEEMFNRWWLIHQAGKPVPYRICWQACLAWLRPQIERSQKENKGLRKEIDAANALLKEIK